MIVCLVFDITAHLGNQLTSLCAGDWPAWEIKPYNATRVGRVRVHEPITTSIVSKRSNTYELKTFIHQTIIIKSNFSEKLRARQKSKTNCLPLSFVLHHEHHSERLPMEHLLATKKDGTLACPNPAYFCQLKIWAFREWSSAIEPLK